MDLLGFIEAAHRALSFFGNGPGSDQSWASDEWEFQKHFGVPYEAFIEIAQHLDSKQEQLLHDTLKVNPEAAVLWILSMEELDG
jgi:hypothetical protein